MVCKDREVAVLLLISAYTSIIGVLAPGATLAGVETGQVVPLITATSAKLPDTPIFPKALMVADVGALLPVKLNAMVALAANVTGPWQLSWYSLPVVIVQDMPVMVTPEPEVCCDMSAVR